MYLVKIVLDVRHSEANSLGSPSPTSPSPAPTTTTQGTPGPTTTSVSGSAWNYLGCYLDNYPRTLNNGFQGTDLSGQSVSTCLSLCASKGYAFGGTEYGVECWCSAAITEGATQVSAGECNMPCSGQGMFKSRMLFPLVGLLTYLLRDRHLWRREQNLFICCECRFFVFPRTNPNPNRLHPHPFRHRLFVSRLRGGGADGLAACFDWSQLLPTRHDSVAVPVSLLRLPVCWRRIRVSLPVSCLPGLSDLSSPPAE